MQHECRSSLVVLALVVGIPTVALAQDAGKSKALRLSVAVGPAFALGKVADAWAKLILERSGGAVAVDLHPGATLAQRDPEREFIALRDGTADLAVGSTLHWSAQVSELAVVGLPWLAPEQRDLEALTTGAIGERLRAAIGRAGAVPLALAPLGHRAIATQSKPVRVPDDLRSLRIRITATPFLVEFYAGFGALPLALPFMEAVDLFRNAGLDAQEGSAASFAAARLDSLGFHHMTLWEGVGELAVFAVNPAVWDAWTADRRELVRNAAEDASKQLAAMVATEQDAALAALKARGINPLRLTATGRASFAAAARPTYDRWAAVAGEDIVRAAEGAVAAAAATRQ